MYMGVNIFPSALGSTIIWNGTISSCFYLKYCYFVHHEFFSLI
jgi:hypothetical protein